MKILIVDDEQLVRWFLDRALKKSGHQVIVASNITEAFSKLTSEDIDIMFLDLKMPEGYGTDLIEKMGDMPRQPKIVVCSAFITSDLEEKFRSKGIHMLKKPFKLEELNRILDICLKS
jgi:DNA-binding NtrC family response regulator